MKKYVLRYWFEHGGTCLWSVSENAKNKFGYPIDNSKLPISIDLINELYELEKEYHSFLDWDYPPNPSPWTIEQKHIFKDRANNAYLKLLSELGSNFEIINDIDNCLR
ncbi:hypothetical protein [Clostridium sp. C8-1-8]|uniref:hypothetical protein n=1 Tax=Clostridium sp. C8-1-8 TaxID=2698831 RepID=UPI0013695CA5|nr:hypothetical protein [Clostridium sp. C8-1-8]